MNYLHTQPHTHTTTHTHTYIYIYVTHIAYCVYMYVCILYLFIYLFIYLYTLETIDICIPALNISDCLLNSPRSKSHSAGCAFPTNETSNTVTSFY